MLLPLTKGILLISGCFIFMAISVAVLCKNQFYYFTALWPESGHVAVDEADILDILGAIQKHADEADIEEQSKSALGIFTSLPRSKWAVSFVFSVLSTIGQRFSKS